MKKEIAMLGMMAAAMGMGAAPTTMNISSAGQVHHLDAVAKDLKESQSQLSERISRGREGIRGSGSGLPPKLYGQWLQSCGRQKWVRKS